MKKKPEFNNGIGYSVRLLVILIIAAMVCITVLSVNKLSAVNEQNQRDIETISKTLLQLEKYAKTQELDEDGKPYINIELNPPDNVEMGDTEKYQLLSIVQQQCTQSVDSISAQITLFSIIIAIVAIVIPIFNYLFLQKEQVGEIKNQFKILDERYKAELERHNNELENLTGQYKTLTENFEKEMIQARSVTAAVAAGSKLSDSEKILPVSNSSEDKARAYYLTARLLHAQNEYQKALSSISQAISEDIANHKYYDFRSLILHVMGRYDEALQDASKAIDLKPNDAQYYVSRGATLQEMLRFSEALIDKTKAIELEPDNAEFYDSRAETFHKMKKYKDALVDSTKSIELEPDNAKYYDNRGLTLLAIKHYEEAHSDMLKAVELEPNNLEYQADLAYSLKCIKQYQRAIELFDKIKDLCDTDYAHRYRAITILQSAITSGVQIPKDEIFKELDRSVEIEPENWRNYNTIAEVSLLLKCQQKAIEALDIADKLDPKNPEVFHFYALYYEAIGDMENANKHHTLADQYGYIKEPE